MKLVCLGDSLTWGGYGGDYVAALREVAPQHDIIRAGVGGNTALNLVARLEDDVLAHQPDACFVLIGSNDAISACHPATRAYYARTHRVPDGVVTEAAFEAAMRDVLVALAAHRVQAYVGLPALEANPGLVATLQRYNALTAAVAGALVVPVLDLLAHFLPDDHPIPARADLSMKTILDIGERHRTGWDGFDAAQAEGGYAFTFDGLHWTHAAAREAATQIARFVGLV